MLLIGARASRPHKCMLLGVRSGRVGAWAVILFRYEGRSPVRSQQSLHYQPLTSRISFFQRKWEDGQI